MSQHACYTPALYSLNTPRAEFKLVATRDHVVLDVQAQNYQTDGRARTEYALAHLSRADAIRLQRLLAEAIAASQDAPDARETARWSLAISTRRIRRAA